MERKKKFRSIEEFGAYLESEGIETDLFGKDEAKSLEDLFSEVQRGVAILSKESGELLRVMRTVVIFVFYLNSENGERFFLKEVKQVFKDGRERKRDFKWSVSEKLEIGEEESEGAIRALKEELGVTDKVRLISLGTNDKRMNSDSYPGLTTIYKNNYYKVFLPRESFKQEGYIEKGKILTTYFEWVKLG